jgi:hypothetical protein
MADDDCDGVAHGNCNRIGVDVPARYYDQTAIRGSAQRVATTLGLKMGRAERSGEPA